MVGGGTHPHPPSRSVIPPIYPRFRAGRELDPVITSPREVLIKAEKQRQLQGELDFQHITKDAKDGCRYLGELPSWIASCPVLGSHVIQRRRRFFVSLLAPEL